MAYLVFADDSRREVSYGTAAAIHQILIGAKEPHSEAQAAYVTNVKAVMFDPVTQSTTVNIQPAAEPDQEMLNLINDYRIRGYNKFVAVGNRLKERRAS